MMYKLLSIMIVANYSYSSVEGVKLTQFVSKVEGVGLVQEMNPWDLGANLHTTKNLALHEMMKSELMKQPILKDVNEHGTEKSPPSGEWEPLVKDLKDLDGGVLTNKSDFWRPLGLPPSFIPRPRKATSGNGGGGTQGGDKRKRDKI
jgi:hypothetical protein